MAILTRLALSNFRNHLDALIAPGPGFVILTGENGAGKTNMLEAVSLLTPGRGLRSATLSAMARTDGPGGFAVSARLLARSSAAGDQADDEVTLGTGTLATAPERRQVRINGAEASATALGEWLALLWLTPAMDRLFVEGTSGRRRFLDRLVLAREPGHASHASRYEAAMRARNKLLAEPDGADPAWLAALEAGMAEHGAALAQARTRTIVALAERLATQPAGPFARAGLALTGWLPAPGDAQSALAAELRKGRGRDAAAGRTLAGPHRTDLAVTHVDKGVPAELCSTGEQKALLLGLILAHADAVAQQRGERPILLLDEVAAHLDPLRRAALFDRLDAAGGQVWMTGTELAAFTDAPAHATRLHVDGGSIESA
jgi:DNA replication and repair protein RecF